MQGKTIQIFLPDGNARSIRIADITSRTVQAIQIPRTKLKESQNRTEVQNVGVYFLFGEESEKALPLAYIGESENCYDRIVQHNRDPKKDFWNTAVVITSKTSSFTKVHGKYLEWYCIENAKDINRYSISQTLANKPYVSESMEADLFDNIEAMRILLSTLGFPIIEPIQKSKLQKDIYHCKRKDYYGNGEYVEDGFIVFNGSKAKINESKAAPQWIVNQRKVLKESFVLKEEGNYLVFQSDYLFNSPSTAAAIIFGIQANGWTEWKRKDGNRVRHSMLLLMNSCTTDSSSKPVKADEIDVISSRSVGTQYMIVTENLMFLQR
ncbi:MAG: GIY-YIG nuclease family protein [Bacteroidetes bacterium]|nr:GIY-YIG nuclease family protein [Bacteroidota bacterium]